MVTRENSELKLSAEGYAAATEAISQRAAIALFGRLRIPSQSLLPRAWICQMLQPFEARH